VTAAHPSDFIPEIARQRAEILRKESADPRRRILVVGIPGSGKTFSGCTTMPKPIVIDYDNQIDDPRCLNGVAGYYPMWDDAFVKNELKLVGTPLQKFEALINLLAPKLTPEYTIFPDSMSTLADKLKENLEARLPTEGKGDNYWFWREWSKAWRLVCTKLKEVRCNVYFTAHESEIRDDATGRLEKFGWILQGREFTPRIPQFFTDVVRQTHLVKTDKDGKIEREEWLWQIKPTDQFPCAKSRCKQSKLQIPATWEEIIK